MMVAGRSDDAMGVLAKATMMVILVLVMIISYHGSGNYDFR